MNRDNISISDHGSEMIAALGKGAYLTTCSGGKVNTMVIGWGTVGILWGKPVCIVYVRESRFTRELLDANPEFTVNFPAGPYDKNIFQICGSKSGRDMDKIAVSGLTPVKGRTVSVPALAGFPVTLECRVLYRREQDLGLIPGKIRDVFYPDGGSGADEHIEYIGEIVDSYILR